MDTVNVFINLGGGMFGGAFWANKQKGTACLDSSTMGNTGFSLPVLSEIRGMVWDWEEP